MRRSFSIPRLAIVVAWAAFAPQSRWSELLPTAMLPDFDPLPPSDASPWNSWAWSYGSPTVTESNLSDSAALIPSEAGNNDAAALGQPLVEDAYTKAIANRQAEIMMRIASEFGFTPASRSRITAPLPDQLPLFDEAERDD